MHRFTLIRKHVCSEATSIIIIIIVVAHCTSPLGKVVNAATSDSTLQFGMMLIADTVKIIIIRNLLSTKREREREARHSFCILLGGRSLTVLASGYVTRGRYSSDTAIGGHLWYIKWPHSTWKSSSLLFSLANSAVSVDTLALDVPLSCRSVLKGYEALH